MILAIRSTEWHRVHGTVRARDRPKRLTIDGCRHHLAGGRRTAIGSNRIYIATAGEEHDDAHRCRAEPHRRAPPPTLKLQHRALGYLRLPDAWPRFTTRSSFIGLRAFHPPLEQLLAVHVVLDHARAIVAVGEIPGVRIHEGHECRPAEVRIVGAGHAWRAQRQQALLAVVRELADKMRVGIDDPDVLLRIVRADLDVMRAAPDAIPLRPI